MPRLTVKLLLVDPFDRLLLIHGRDPADGCHHWYPVGGGIEVGESHHEAAAREAWEETGLTALPAGETVWTRHPRCRALPSRRASLASGGGPPTSCGRPVTPSSRRTSLNAMRSS